MARRFTSEATPKPKESLRYRISPIDKEYDKLDGLDRELEAIADKLEPEVYHEYYDVLQARRERLESRRLRELGKVAPKAYTAPQKATSYNVPRARVVTHRPAMSPFAMKLLGICIVLTIFKILA